MKEYIENHRVSKLIWMWMGVVILVGFGVYAMIQQLYFEKPVGNNPMSDKGLVITVIITALIIVLMMRIHLKLRIDDKGVHAAIFPIHFKMQTYSWDKIQTMEVRRYHPLREFGGWGYRINLKGNKAYSITGKNGLELTFQNGRKLMIGTQQPDELRAFLQQHPIASSKL